MKSIFNKVTASLLTAVTLLSFSACNKDTKTSADKKFNDAKIITLSESTAKIDGDEIEVFDYTWHCDPSTAHTDVKNAPAEYYTGTKPQTNAAAYIDNELYYYPELPEAGFKKVNYDGENEWAYYYTDGENNDYIFATLPTLGNSLPTQMMHSEQEASENKVLHITEAGKYVLCGKWKGQVRIDLGDPEKTFTDENAKITIILDNADIDCSVAPGIVFYSAYECDNQWEENEKHTADIDISSAGVSVIIADDSENSVSGANIFRMLKTKYKTDESNETVKVQKKMRKNDAAFYSYISMNIDGEEKNNGKLNVTSSFEGIDSELHLAINGGNITINSQDDGINVNEDNVSVVCFNGGNTTINAGLGAEGDGVDSNGFVKINGGTIAVNGIKAPDSSIDSENGIYYVAGTVTVDGQEYSIEADTVLKEIGNQNMHGYMNNDMHNDFRQQPQNFNIKDFKEKVAALDDDATFDDIMKILGMTGKDNMDKPADEQPPQMPDRNQIPEKLQENK